VAFSWTGTNPEGVPDLWIKAVDGEARRQLTDTPFAEGFPAWSPDGREIAFARGGKGVFIVSALGGQERQVMDSGSIVGWTPDSRSLLVRDRTPEGPHGIVRIDLPSGNRHQVTRAPSGIGDWTFDVSPDGKTLAFVRYERPGIGDVYTVPMAGGEVRRRTNGNGSMSRVAWTPDGRDILYSNNESVFRIAAESERVDRGRNSLSEIGRRTTGASSSTPRSTGTPTCM
jgi:Tol biopolymer transport system component